MKQMILLFLIVSFFCTSCMSLSVFNDPNDFSCMHGRLYLKNGDSLTGKLTIDEGFSGTTIKIYLDGEKKPMQFKTTDVMGYAISNNYYFLKKLNGGLFAGKEYAFMKRISPPQSRIHLYEYKEKIKSSKGSTVRHEILYCLQIPNEPADIVWPLNSSRFVPDFEEKMSTLLQDCPSLSQKISAKQQGYFYPQVMMFKENRAEVLLHIIEEYNSCQ